MDERGTVIEKTKERETERERERERDRERQREREEDAEDRGKESLDILRRMENVKQTETIQIIRRLYF